MPDRYSNFSGAVARYVQRQKVSAKTSGYVVVAGDSGTRFTNTGAIASVTFSLPAAAVELVYAFSITAAFTDIVDAAGSDIIRVGTEQTSAGGNYSNNQVGSVLFMVCDVAGVWAATPFSGLWTPA